MPSRPTCSCGVLMIVGRRGVSVCLHCDVPAKHLAAGCVACQKLNPPKS